MSWILRLGPRIFAPRTGKLCPSRDDAKGANHAEFANVRQSRIAIRPAVIACWCGRVHGGGETAVWRKRRDQNSGRRRRGLFAWRMDRPASSRVPWAGSFEDDEYDQGRPSGAMPRIYCARCGRPNPDGARFCSHCGTQLAASVPPGSGLRRRQQPCSPTPRPSIFDLAWECLSLDSPTEFLSALVPLR